MKNVINSKLLFGVLLHTILKAAFALSTQFVFSMRS